MNNKCPCAECICMAICCGKDFSDLMVDCQLISNYYYLTEASDTFDFRYNTIVEVLNPSWR